jgi:nitroreductase
MIATTEHPVHELIASRWSPYAFARQSVADEDLHSLFEAARWAPSSYNEQPWSYVVAKQEERDEFERLLSCLVEGNQAWARFAPVLAIGITRLFFRRNGKPNRAAAHDLGLASASLVLEATARGLCVHQMIGIVPEKARELYAIPQEHEPLTGIAIGYPGAPASIPQEIRERDRERRPRRPMREFVFHGRWGSGGP